MHRLFYKNNLVLVCTFSNFTLVIVTPYDKLLDTFLAGLYGGSKCIWVYPWWGVLPVFITTCVPFFLASNYINCFKPKVRNILLISAWGLVVVLLAVLIPLQII